MCDATEVDKTYIAGHVPNHGPIRHAASTDSPHVAFDPGDFDDLIHRALLGARNVPERYASLLTLLSGCGKAHHDTPVREQGHSAGYPCLATTGYGVGMTKAECVQRCSVAECIPLVSRRTGHILSKVKRSAA